MPRAERPYSRVYWDAPDDERFARVWPDDRALAAWLRLLIAADMAYPRPVYVPAGIHRPSLRILTECGLVELTTDGRYRIHGLQAERERRSAAAREAGLASGRSRKGDDEPPEPSADPPGPTPPGNGGGTNGERPLNAGATRTTGRGRGQEDEDETEGSSPLPLMDEPDVLDAWYRLTASAPTKPAIRDWLDRLEREYGAGEVCSALAECHREDLDRSTLLGRTQNRLWERAHARSKERERDRVDAAAEERRRMDEMTPEQRAANMARLRDLMAGAGILPTGDRGGPPTRLGQSRSPDA